MGLYRTVPDPCPKMAQLQGCNPLVEQRQLISIVKTKANEMRFLESVESLSAEMLHWSGEIDTNGRFSASDHFEVTSLG
jgi:hypothetical protein